MLGYWAIGNARIDRAPNTMMAMAMTQAKMGRSMKKRDMDVVVDGCGGKDDGGRRDDDRVDQRPGVVAAIFPGALVAGAAGTPTVACTPGLTPCRPSTITRSPIFNPLSTNH